MPVCIHIILNIKILKGIFHVVIIIIIIKIDHHDFLLWNIKDVVLKKRKKNKTAA